MYKFSRILPSILYYIYLYIFIYIYIIFFYKEKRQYISLLSFYLNVIMWQLPVYVLHCY